MQFLTNDFLNNAVLTNGKTPLLIVGVEKK
jgi:hypothetical protein